MRTNRLQLEHPPTSVPAFCAGAAAAAPAAVATEVASWLEWEESVLRPATYIGEAAALAAALAHLAEALASREFLAGGALTLADIAVFATLLPLATASPTVCSHAQLTRVKGLGRHRSVHHAAAAGCGALDGALVHVQPTPVKGPGRHRSVRHAAAADRGALDGVLPHARSSFPRRRSWLHQYCALCRRTWLHQCCNLCRNGAPLLHLPEAAHPASALDTTELASAPRM